MQSNKAENSAEVKEIKVSTEEAPSKISGKKFVKIGGIFFLLVVLILFVSPLLLDGKGLKMEIEKKISEIYGTNFVINGDVKIAFLPSPTIIAKSAYLLSYQPKVGENIDSKKIYNFYADLIKIKMSFFGKKIQAITVSGAILESYYFDRQPVATNEKFASFLAHDPLVSSSGAGFFSLAELKDSDIAIKNIPLIIVKNSTLALYDKSADKKQFEKINLEMLLAQEKTRVNGNFTTSNNLSEIDLKFYFNDNSKDNKSTFSLNSPIAKITAKGDFASENKGFSTDFSGEINGEISDLKSFYNNFWDEEGVIAGKLKQNNQQIKFSAKLDGSNGQINISNLEISSSLMKGKGNIALDVAPAIPMIDIGFKLEQLDIDNLWSGEFVSLAMPKYKQEVKPVADNKIAASEAVVSEESGMTGIRHIDLTADIKIASAKYLEGEIKNIDLYITVANRGQVLILPLMFTTPDGGNVWLSGVFDNDAVPARFVGKFSVLGKNLNDILKWSKLELQNLKGDSLREFKMHSDLILWPNSKAFDNFYLSLSDNKNEFLGSIKIDDTQKPSKIAVNFGIDDFKVENYFQISSQSTYFSPGLLIKKIFWLNNLSFDSNIALRFGRLVYKDEEFFDQQVNLILGLGHFGIDKLHLKSDKTDAQFDLNIDISKNPKFELVASANEFHYENLDDAKAEKSSLVDKIVKSVSKNKSRNFVDQFYALPSLEGFGGKIEFDFAQLDLDGFKIKNAKLFGKLKDGNLTIDDSLGEIYNGSANYRGLLGLKTNKIINGNLTLENTALKPLLTDLFGLENIDGIANISSSIVASAGKKEEFFDAFSSDIKFNANAPSLMGYGLDDLVSKMFAPQNNMAALANPEKILFNKDSTTVFKNSDGTLQIKNGGSGLFKINTTGLAANGILSGNIDLKNNQMDALYNLIFLSGNRSKQVPINIVSNIKGDMGDAVQNTNLNQVRQYLGLSVLQEKTVIIKNDEKQVVPSSN